MQTERIRQERIVEISFKALQRFEQQQTQFHDLISAMKMAAIQFRLQNYSSALNYHLSAIGLTSSKKNIDLINVLIILDYLALGQVEEALKLFIECEKREQNKDFSMFYLQVYYKLGLTRRYLIVYMILRQRTNAKKVNLLISCTWLIKVYEEYGNVEKMDIAFRKSCRLLSDLSSIDRGNFYEIFQAAYFLLRFSFRKYRYEYRKSLTNKIRSFIDFIEKNLDPLVSQSLMEQLKAGKQYDFCMLCIDS